MVKSLTACRHLKAERVQGPKQDASCSQPHSLPFAVTGMQRQPCSIQCLSNHTHHYMTTMPTPRRRMQVAPFRLNRLSAFLRKTCGARGATASRHMHIAAQLTHFRSCITKVKSLQGKLLKAERMTSRGWTYVVIFVVWILSDVLLQHDLCPDALPPTSACLHQGKPAHSSPSQHSSSISTSAILRMH